MRGVQIERPLVAYDDDGNEIDPFPTIPTNVRRVIEVYFETGDYKKASAAGGVDVATARRLVQGKNRPEARMVLQRLLESRGLDFASLADKLVSIANSERAQWNPKDGRWDFFPDNHAQLGATREAAKLLDLEPPKDGLNAVGVKIEVTTNLFGGEAKEVPGTFEATAITSEPVEENS